jgi:hypothetical protein
MLEYKDAIEKICKYTFNFTNIDTMFIDSESNIQLEYGYTQVPETLKPYYSNINAPENISIYKLSRQHHPRNSKIGGGFHE